MSKRKRTSGINIRVTPQEKKRIASHAKKCKLSVSEYLRQLSMGYTPRELPGDELYEIFWRLKLLQDNYNDSFFADTVERFDAYIHPPKEDL